MSTCAGLRPAGTLSGRVPYPNPSPRAFSPRLVGGLLAGACGAATIVALVWWLRTGSSQGLYIAGTFWAVAGIIAAIFRGIDEVPDAIARLLTNVGVTRAGDSFSDVEAMVAQGNYEMAAESYRMRATGARRGWATLGRVRLLAGELNRPAEAIQEVDGLFASGARVSPAEEFALRAFLADTLAATGATNRARRELQHLLTRYPSSPGAPVIRSRLEALMTDPTTEQIA